MGYALLLGTPQDSGRREDMPLDMLNPGAVRIQPPQGNLTGPVPHVQGVVAQGDDF